MQDLSKTILAFRGYNVTNLGRTPELLADPRYGPILEVYLNEASQVYSRVVGRSIRLIDRVRRRRETTLRTYGQAVALIVAVEMAQLAMLKECHGIDWTGAAASMGYSLGEITALAAGGVVDWRRALEVPVSLAEPCAALARDVTLAVVFTRQATLAPDTLRRLCLEVNAAGRGVMGVSAFLGPNSVLVMGQADTLDRFQQLAKERFEERLIVRKNQHRWPPLHTPIVWQRCVADQAGTLMHGLPIEFRVPAPPVLSFVTGDFGYNELNARHMLRRWVDHPQRLWDAVKTILGDSVKHVLHIGPQPNILPATLKRLSDNVTLQLEASVGKRALAAVARRPWLAALLPEETALLRAPQITQTTLEDWLLEH